MKQILLICTAGVLLGCGTKTPEQETNAPDANPPAKPKVEPTKATLTPRMEAAEKSYAIFSEKLDPNHPKTKDTKAHLDELKE